LSENLVSWIIARVEVEQNNACLRIPCIWFRKYFQVYLPILSVFFSKCLIIGKNDLLIFCQDVWLRYGHV